MAEYPSSFPKRLFRWFVVKQIGLTAILFVVITAALDVWLEYSQGATAEQVALIRLAVATSLGVGFLAIVLISFYMARGLVIPLGRLIRKTRRLRKYPFESEDLSESEWALDEPGEWYDLERALNKLGQDLRQKTIRLSREKTELRAIMAAVNEAILAVDQNGRPLFFNSQFALLFGTAGRDTQNLALQDMLRNPVILEAYRQCLREETAVRVECELVVEDHPLAHIFVVSVSPLRKKHNQEIYGAVGIFHDITELKKAEKIRIEFVGNVSHELRTPLTSIKGYIQVLESDFRSGQVAQAPEFLSIVSKNVDRLILLVNDLLDLSSLESGTEIKRGEILTQEATESVLRQLNPRDHVIKIHYGVSHLRADLLRVEQVLRNLVQNAIRYVPKGQTIEIGWEELPAHGVRLRVKDSGPGISLEHQARLFERFYRIDEARSREVGGTGIGLSIVKHIMQRHGGSVRVISQPGQGAEFLCDFP